MILSNNIKYFYLFLIGIILFFLIDITFILHKHIITLSTASILSSFTGYLIQKYITKRLIDSLILLIPILIFSIFMIFANIFLFPFETPGILIFSSLFYFIGFKYPIYIKSKINKLS